MTSCVHFLNITNPVGDDVLQTMLFKLKTQYV